AVNAPRRISDILSPQQLENHRQLNQWMERTERNAGGRTFWDYLRPNGNGERQVLSRTVEHFQIPDGQAPWSYRIPYSHPNEPVVYWMINERTGQVLKVGDGVASTVVETRWLPQQARLRTLEAQRLGVSESEVTIRVNYLRFDPSVSRRGPASP